jgi:uracil-DNA glycosylase
VWAKRSLVRICLEAGWPFRRWTEFREIEAWLAETVAAWRDYLPRFLPMPHPSWRNTAWLKSNPWVEEDVLRFLRARVAQMLAR